MFAATFKHFKGEQSKVPLSVLRDTDIKQLKPIRQAYSTRHQQNTQGFFWMSSTNQMVYHESYTERKVLLQFDFARVALHVVSQPFRLHTDEFSHTPDFLILTKEGVRVLNVKLKSKILSERFQIAHQATQTAMSEINWDYEARSEPPAQLYSCLDWLSAFRRVPLRFDEFAPQILNHLADVGGIKPFDEIVDQFGHSVLIKPILFHLLWQQTLRTNMDAPFSGSMLISLSPPKEERWLQRINGMHGQPDVQLLEAGFEPRQTHLPIPGWFR